MGYPYSWKEIYRFRMLCFTLYLRAISKYKRPGSLYLEGELAEGFLRYEFGGLMFVGAYTWRGLFSEFYGIIFIIIFIITMIYR